jgi:MFS family permease
MGIGGEYAAINSAIDEMMPARYRGRVDVAINGTYWGGAILGTLLQLLLLNTLDHGPAWRLGFLVGPAIGLCIWKLRRNLPESPRWLIIHGRTGIPHRVRARQPDRPADVWQAVRHDRAAEDDRRDIRSRRRCSRQGC